MIQRVASAGVGCVVFFLSVRASFALEDLTASVRVEKTPLGGQMFVRGDANADGKVDISDPVYTLGYLFLGLPPPGCAEALNADDSDKLDISDAIYVLGFLFLGGQPPKAPFPRCGVDPTPGLGCASYPPCGGSGNWSVKVRNVSGEEILAPLIATVDSVSDPSVTVENEDGAYVGKPYFDYSALLAGGSLPSGAETAERTWVFRNPSGVPFDFGVKVYASAPGGGGWVGGADPLGEGPPAPERKAGRIDPDVVEYSVRVPGFPFRPRMERPGRFQALSTEVGNRLGDIGKPGVPTFAQLLAVPRGGEIMVEVTEGEGVRYGGFRLYPAQHPPDDNEDAEPPPFAFDENFYARDVLYPESLARVAEFEFRGSRIAVVELALARANPGKGELIVYPEVKVRIEFGREGFGRDDYIDPADRALESERVLGVGLLNADVVRGDALGTVRDRVRLSFADLLIVAPRAFEAAAEELAVWKRACGYTTIVGYTDAIGTTAADIAEYVRNVYARKRISYLLLFGDAEHIPPHYRTRHPTGQSPRRMGTDLYYATMGPAGDIVPDIAYGRIPASTAAEAALAVAKIRGYEGSPPGPNEFYRRATLAAYFQDTDPRNDVEDRLFTRAQEDASQFFAAKAKVPVRVFTASGGDPRWWEDGTPVPFWLRRPGFAWDGDAADISASIASGTFLLTHRDHASWNGWSDPAYGLDDIAGLTNGDLLPVVFSINCQTGWFDRETDEEGAETSGESFAENFLLKSGGGAVAVIAATRNSPSYANDRLYRGLLDCVWPDFIPGYPGLADAEAAELAGSRGLGWMLNYAKLYVLSEYPTERDGGANLDGIRVHQREFEIFHCLGDPTLELRVAPPVSIGIAMEALHPFLSDYTWACAFEYDGARIAVVRGAGCERTLGSGIVSGGEVHLFFPLEEPLRPDQDLYFVASKEGCTPYATRLEVRAASILDCLEVPVGRAGTAGLAEHGVAADGDVVALGAVPLSGTGDQLCCSSGFVGTSKYLFAGHNQSGGIEMLELLPGSLPTPVAGSPFPTKGGQPSYFAVNEAGTLLFATTADGMVESFAISGGALAPLKGSPTDLTGAARALAAWTPLKETYLYVGSMASPKAVHAFRVPPGGPEFLGTFDLEKSGANRPGVDLEVARNRRVLYVRDLDAGIFALAMDPATGGLSLVRGSPFDAGGFGSAIALARKEAYLYAAAERLKPQISCFRIEATGALTPIGAAASPPVIVSLVSEPSGQFLLGASREGDGIARWKILADGTLEYLGLTPDGSAEASPAGLWAR